MLIQCSTVEPSDFEHQGDVESFKLILKKSNTAHLYRIPQKPDIS